MTSTVAIVGLGSNVGSREAFLREAARLLGDEPGIVLEDRSRLYRSAAVGPPQPDFLNAAARIRTALPPAALLERLMDIEARLGRVRTRRWGPRTIDLDVLFWSGGSVATPTLTVPHPRLRERPFALAPLIDVAPELESVHGDALDALGGPPPMHPWADAVPSPEGLVVDASDDIDALALASGAWSCAADEVAPLQACSPEEWVRIGGRAIASWDVDVIRGFGNGGRAAAAVWVEEGRCRIVGR